MSEVTLGKGPRKMLVLLEDRCTTRMARDVPVGYLADRLGVCTRTAHRYLRALRLAGLIEREMGRTRLVDIGDLLWR